MWISYPDEAIPANQFSKLLFTQVLRTRGPLG